MKYIDSEKLKAEIKRRKFEWEAILNINNIDNLIAKNCCYEDDAILDFIDSLQQEQTVVDIEKEYTEFVVSDPVYSKLVNGIVGKSIARHFYELGINARKEK